MEMFQNGRQSYTAFFVCNEERREISDYSSGMNLLSQERGCFFSLIVDLIENNTMRKEEHSTEWALVSFVRAKFYSKTFFLCVIFILYFKTLK